MDSYRHRFSAMSCPCELVIHAESQTAAERIFDLCVEEALRFEAKYSRYREDSVTTRINRSAGRSPVTIDPETASILKYSDVCYAQSNALFDITAGVLREIWFRNMTELPSHHAVLGCLELIGWERVVCEVVSEEETVYLPEKGMELDFGGVVKEYAADAIAALATTEGISHGFINLGGDIRIIGPKPDGSPWPVGIAHPQNSEQPIATIHLKDGALATSGSYARCFEIDGRRYSHLISPRTGWPVDGLLSVSVNAPQAVVAGSLTSIAMLQPEEEAIDFLESCRIPFFAVDSGLGCHGHLAEAVDA